MDCIFHSISSSSPAPSFLNFYDFSFLTETYLDNCDFAIDNLFLSSSEIVIHGCAIISSKLIRFFGSPTKIFETKSLASSDTLCQVSTSKSYLHYLICSNRAKLSSS